MRPRRATAVADDRSSECSPAGLRIGEALALRRGDVNLARGELVVRRSKTEAGERVVVLPSALVEALVEWKNADELLRSG